jgi:hypothetical protein
MNVSMETGLPQIFHIFMGSSLFTNVNCIHKRRNGMTPCLKSINSKKFHIYRFLRPQYYKIIYLPELRALIRDNLLIFYHIRFLKKKFRKNFYGKINN